MALYAAINAHMRLNGFNHLDVSSEGVGLAVAESCLHYSIRGESALFSEEDLLMKNRKSRLCDFALESWLLDDERAYIYL